MGADADRLLSVFIDAWNAGADPDAGALIDGAPASEREKLAAGIEAFLALAPAPPVAARPDALVAWTGALHGEAGLWPALLPRLRERAGLSLGDLAGRLGSALGLAPSRAAKTEDYLGRMERGELPPAGVSRRVIDALGAALRIDPGELLAAAGPGPVGPAPALFRAATGPSVAGGPPPPLPGAPPPPMTASPASPMPEVDLSILADAMLTAAPSTWDEVDELFRGGR